MGNGIPQLTLEPQLEAKAEEAAPKAAAEVKMEETVLSAEEKSRPWPSLPSKLT